MENFEQEFQEAYDRASEKTQKCRGMRLGKEAVLDALKTGNFDALCGGQTNLRPNFAQLRKELQDTGFRCTVNIAVEVGLVVRSTDARGVVTYARGVVDGDSLGPKAAFFTGAAAVESPE